MYGFEKISEPKLKFPSTSGADPLCQISLKSRPRFEPWMSEI